MRKFAIVAAVALGIPGLAHAGPNSAIEIGPIVSLEQSVVAKNGWYPPDWSYPIRPCNCGNPPPSNPKASSRN